MSVAVCFHDPFLEINSIKTLKFLLRRDVTTLSVVVIYSEKCLTDLFQKYLGNLQWHSPLLLILLTLSAPKTYKYALLSEKISGNWKSQISPKKLFSFWRYLNFCSNFFVKLRLISKYMTSLTGKQIITIHILPNISRGKGNQTVKFIQLIEHNVRNIFLEKSYTICGGGTSPKPFSKNQNWANLWVNSLMFSTLCFYCISKSRAIEIYWN